MQAPAPPRREGKKAVRKRTLDLKTPSPELHFKSQDNTSYFVIQNTKIQIMVRW